MRVTFQLDDQLKTMAGENALDRLRAAKTAAGDRLKIVSFEEATDDEKAAILEIAEQA